MVKLVCFDVFFKCFCLFSWGVFLGLVVIFSLFGWFCGVVCCVLWVYFEKYRVFVVMFFGNQVIYVCGRFCRVVCCSLCVIWNVSAPAAAPCPITLSCSFLFTLPRPSPFFFPFSHSFHPHPMLWHWQRYFVCIVYKCMCNAPFYLLWGADVIPHSIFVVVVDWQTTDITRSGWFRKVSQQCIVLIWKIKL